jgi:hypothetical protein
VIRIAPADFHVPFRALAFPSGTVPYHGELVFSCDDLAHALFTTGRAPGDQMAHGVSSIYELLHRSSLVPAYVRRAYNALLVRSNLALALDRSELGALSYALGQAMTGIFCRTQLGVSHLLHVDRYAGQYGVRFGAGRRRADLFGLAPNGWVAAEAKGRSGSMPYALRRTLEEQKRSIVSISGDRPWVAAGCVASFPRRTGGMRVDAFDPDKSDIEAISVNITRDQFMLSYYAPFLRAFDVGQVSTDDYFQSAYFADLNLRVGLPRPMVERLRRAEAGVQSELYPEILDLLAREGDRLSAGFPDGSMIETDWQSSVERRDWGTFEQ